MSKTTDGLKAAFAGESQANRKYLSFAKKADEEGHTYIARLFRAAAHAETVHALNHWRALGGVQSTADNLKTAIEGEHYEVTSMYPPFITAAEEEGDKKAHNSFKWAWEVEKVHENFFRQALANLDKNVEEGEFYVCPICGHTHYGKSAPEKCPVCGALGSKYELVK